MSQDPFLTRVVIENYKSIAACDVKLGPLMFLIGPNGAGKSNFLDALRFVSDALSFSLDYALQNRLNADHILHRSISGRSKAFRIALEFRLPNNQEGKYSLQVGLNDAELWEVQQEECVLPAGAQNGSGYYFRIADGDVESNEDSMPTRDRDQLYLIRAGGISRYRVVMEALRRMRFYNPDPANMCSFRAKDTGDFLSYRGDNIATVIAYLHEHDEVSQERVRDYMSLILPGFRDVDSKDVGPGRLLRIWQQSMEGCRSEPFWATQISEGTLRALAILVALRQSRPQDHQRPTLVGIEDVEAAIYPGALGVLRDAMVEASYSTQVVVTTQSSDLLDDKEINTDSILAVSMSRGQTRIGPIDEASRSVLRKHLYTVGELLRIGQLFPETSNHVESESTIGSRETGDRS